MRCCLMSRSTVVGAGIDVHLDSPQPSHVMEEPVADLFGDGMALGNAAIAIDREVQVRLQAVTTPSDSHGVDSLDTGRVSRDSVNLGHDGGINRVHQPAKHLSCR